MLANLIVQWNSELGLKIVKRSNQKEQGGKKGILNCGFSVDDITHGKNILPTDLLTFCSLMDI